MGPATGSSAVKPPTAKKPPAPRKRDDSKKVKSEPPAEENIISAPPPGITNNGSYKSIVVDAPAAMDDLDRDAEGEDDDEYPYGLQEHIISRKN